MKTLEDLPKRWCPGCEESKVLCLHFSPKGQYCNECAVKNRKKHAGKYNLRHYLKCSKEDLDHKRVMNHFTFGIRSKFDPTKGEE